MNRDDRDALPFQHYTLKHRVIAWVSENLCGNLTYRQRHGLIKGLKRRGGLGWLPESLTNATVTAEQKFWRSQNFNDLVVYDVGAFQGLLTMFFARQCRRVISYEPNTRNHARLMENVSLNNLENVLVRKVGLGAKGESAKMVVSPLMPGGASIEPNTVKGLLTSTSSMTEEIQITTLDNDIREMSLPTPEFIKIDIEGAELPAIQGARETLLLHQPQLFIEMHGETMELKRSNVAAVVDSLESAGYRDILHIETGTTITTRNSEIAAEGHLYCPGR
jgi:FkbM family methyltransferase